MGVISSVLTGSETEKVFTREKCFHCGEDCPDKKLVIEEKHFCCHGCLSVYQLLNKTGLCTYYDLNAYAGVNRRKEERHNKFAFVDEPSIAQSLISFKEAGQVHVTFYIPFIHCSSCVYLLENLHKLDSGILRSDIQFLKKEVSIIYDESQISLRKVVELLYAIGYEPHLSLNELDKKKNKIDRSLIYKLGVAGFCFGNIMLLSFPEYFAHDANQEQFLGNIFRYLNVILALPVFFYSASPFFISGWKGLKHKHLNIDFPVALAILATFIRSLTEVFSGAGGGYFDSMAGIVFFMLVGRVLQDKTYKQLSFERNYTDYFPAAATVIDKEGNEVPTPLSKVKSGDTLRIFNNELITADGILLSGNAQIDYSFVTGESVPVKKEIGKLIYAGGKQLGGIVEILTIKEVAQSYLTSLWNKDAKYVAEKDNERSSYVHKIAQNFTLIVMGIAFLAAMYWWKNDPSKIWPAITAVLIIACPCGLLLTSTFTNGYVMRILGKNGLFLRNAHVIEPLGRVNHVVFDKTGTLTSSQSINAILKGDLTDIEKQYVASLAVPTTHALSKPVKKLLGTTKLFPVESFKEYAGLGAEGIIDAHFVRIGTSSFMKRDEDNSETGTVLWIEINGEMRGYFILQQSLREGLTEMFQRLKQKVKFSLLSGDAAYQKAYFSNKLGHEIEMQFGQKPEEKLAYIRELQSKGNVVAMTGDGLNDAGALKASDVGICIAEDMHQFTPAGDVILEGDKLKYFDRFIKFCSASKNIIKVCFGFSVVYNVIGIFFAVQGLLSPLMAAILMPSSTFTIILLTFISSKLLARSACLGA